MSKMIDIEEARRLVLARTPDLAVESSSLEDSAGRVLAEDVLSDRDFPPFHRSAMDGFAVRSADLGSLPALLRVVGEVPAGVLPEGRVQAGETMRIMTGAPVPDGADAVVRVEDTVASKEGSTVEIRTSVPSGRHIDPRGSLIPEGKIVLKTGTRLLPAALGVAASVGCSSLRVRCRPRVAFVSTGDELVEIDERPGPAQIRNSNRITIASQVHAEGGRLVSTDLVPDTLEATREILRRRCGEVDLLVFSGGVSMGEYDFVHRAMREEGIDLAFEKVAIKPGKPLCFGRSGETLLFGLPGNPVSSYMTFLLFVVPALRKMAGRQDLLPAHVPALLAAGVEVVSTGRTQYLPAKLERDSTGWLLVRPLPWRGSSDLSGLVGIDCFLEVPAGEESFGEGQALRVLISEAHVGATP